MKLLVITQRGRVVGTQALSPARKNAPASVALRAGHGQKLQEVAVADPGDLSTAKAIDAFHRRIATSLRPRKTVRSKAKP
jgi:hypothetical protein